MTETFEHAEEIETLLSDRGTCAYAVRPKARLYAKLERNGPAEVVYRQIGDDVAAGALLLGDFGTIVGAGNPFIGTTVFHQAAWERVLETQHAPAEEFNRIRRDIVIYMTVLSAVEIL